MRYWSLLLCLCVISANVSFSRNYYEYHTYINRAEKCFFLEGQRDSALFYYDMVFSRFDSVFAKDCYMAAQIAYYTKSNKYISYLRKGFANGLQPAQLKLSKVLMPVLSDSTAMKMLTRNYDSLRKHYLNRLNPKIMKEIVNHVSADQEEKNTYNGNVYLQKLEYHLSCIAKMIKTVGFPGDMLIGLDQADILKELKVYNSDYANMYYKYRNSNVSRSQFDVRDECIAQTEVFILLIHHPCAYDYFLSDWTNLIATGQVHPRDVALIYDLRIGHLFGNGNGNERNYCLTNPVKHYYKIDNLFTNYDSLKCSRKCIDSMRTQLYINPLSVDSARQTYKKIGFKVDFGVWNSR